MTAIHVVVPVYNCRQFVRSAVESVLYQPYDQIDVVLVDDGSTDGSGAICDELAEQKERVRVIHQSNRGVSEARNAGIDFVLGQPSVDGYLAFLDADDFWCPNCVTKELLQRIEQKKGDICGFGMITCTPDGKRFSNPSCYTERSLNGGNQAIWKLQHHFASHLYSIDLLRRWGIRFYSKARYSEDKYFRFQCAFLADSVELFPDLLYVYRDNPSGAMAVSKVKKPAEYFLPIIDGWLWSDRFINALSDRSGLITEAGGSLANVYMVDMASEHCKRGLPLAEIQQVIQNHPNYGQFVAMKSQGPGDRYYQEHLLLVQKPQLFYSKYFLIGLVERPADFLMHSRMLSGIRSKMKYPLQDIPE